MAALIIELTSLKTKYGIEKEKEKGPSVLLQHACDLGNCEDVAWLLNNSNGIDINKASETDYKYINDNNTPLLIATFKNRIKIVELLLKTKRY